MRPSRPLLIAMIALLAAGAAAIVLLRDDSERRKIPAGFYGANAPLFRVYAETGEAAKLDALAESMAAEGLDWARVVFDQSVEQKFPGRVDWGIPDTFVGALARHGVRTDALFLGTALWAADPGVVRRCGARSFPGDVQAWADFVGAAAERYGRDGRFWSEHPETPELPIEVWEIGNEQNARNFWCPGADPEHYAKVYDASREAVIAADPEAEVIVGGLAPVSESTAGYLTVSDFLERMVAADPSLADRIPAVAIHPYAATPPEVLRTSALYREAMHDAGLGETPMLVNEVGWYTSGPPGPLLTSEGTRAKRIAALAAAFPETSCEIDGFGVHSWFTAELDTANPEDWYGIADPTTGAHRAGGEAYGDAVAEARSRDAERPSLSTVALCD